VPGSDQITVHCDDYEHCQGLSGRFDGLDVTWIPTSAKACFALALDRMPFEIAEFSLANYAMFRDRGVDWLTALPIFPYRRFRHGLAYVHRDSSIRSPEDLRGRRVGVADYSMSAAVWARGIFLSQYGLDWRDVFWISGPKQRFPAPDGVKLSKVEEDLEALFAAGEIDALFSTDISQQAVASGRFRPLFQDHYAEETAFYKSTGIFPPNHVMVINRDVVRDPAAIAGAVFAAFVRSKWRAYRRRLGATLLPWGESRWNDALELFGPNPLPYGRTPQNAAAVEMLTGFLVQQGLAKRAVPWRDLFVDLDYPADEPTG
jgi:4,5-dihydroxyphthalate decarboxylase